MRTATGSSSSSRLIPATSRSFSTRPRTRRSPEKARLSMMMEEQTLNEARDGRRPLAELEQHRGFVDRHIGTTGHDQKAMLKVLGYASRAALMDAIVPAAI